MQDIQDIRTIQDPRNRILAAAQLHFVTLGYNKTTMGDIAETAGMSPANIYRFFRNKEDVVEACARIHLGAVEAHALDIALRADPAADRIVAYLSEIHQLTRESYLRYAKLHEIVEVMCTNRRPVIEAHEQTMSDLLKRIIVDGQAAGVFDRGLDAADAAQTICDAAKMFMHPIMVEEHIDQDLPQKVLRLARFLLRALAPDGKRLLTTE